MSIFAMPARRAWSAPGRSPLVRRSPSPPGTARVMLEQWSMYGTYSEFVFGEIRRRPEAARVPVADELRRAGLVEQHLGVDVRDAGLDVDVVENEMLGVSYGNGIAQRNSPVARSFTQMPPPSPDRDRDVALHAFRHVRVDPLHVPRIGIDDRADQRLLLVDVHVPVVAGQMLVVPDELARVGVAARPSSCCRDRPAHGAGSRRRCRRAGRARVFGIGLAMPQ